MNRFSLLLFACFSLAACKSGDVASTQPSTSEASESEQTATEAQGDGEDGSVANEAGAENEAGAPAAELAEPVVAAPAGPGSVATTDGTAIRTNGELPLDYLRALPAGAAMYVALDVDALVAHYAASTGVESDEQRILLGRQLGPLFAGESVPEALRGNVLLHNAQSIAMAAWEDDSIMVVTEPAVLANAPAEGENLVIAETTIAVRGGRLFMGTGPQFTSALEGPRTGFDLAGSWPAGVARIPEGASVVLALPSFSTLEDAPAELNSVRQALFATGMGTESVLVFDSDIDAELRGYLGRAQHEASAGLQQMKMLAPPFAQAWVGYVELVANSLWAQVTLETEGTMTVLGLAAPQCGSIGSFHIAALLAGAISAGAMELEGPLTPFESVEQRVQDGCAAVPGPRPNLPRDFAGMAGAAVDGNRVVAMMDLGAILRTNLPTLFQLLPYSLHPDDLTEVMGPTPLGLNGLDDGHGVLGAYVVDPADQPEQAVFVLPAGTDGYIPIPTPTGFTQSVVEDVGNVFAMEGSEELIGQRLDVESPWGRLVHSLPSSTVLSVAVTQSLLQEIASEVSDTPSLVRDAQVAAIAVDADLNFAAHFYVGTNAQVLEETTRAEIAEYMEQALADSTDEERALAELMFGQIRDSIQVGSEMDDIVHISLNPRGGPSGGLFGLGSAFMLPALSAYLSASDSLINVYPDPALKP